VVVNLGDDGAFHAVFAERFHHGVARVEGDACAGHLRRMHAVAADARGGVDDGGHLAAGLEQLERDD
jgi:hypothetical protein